MYINSSSIAINGLRFASNDRLSSVTSVAQKGVLPANNAFEFSTLRRHVIKLGEALNLLKELPSSHRIAKQGNAAIPGRAISASDLALTNTQLASATFESSEEINSTPTSFGPRGPEFIGVSGSVPTIGGVYEGSNGTDTLTFRVASGGFVGVSPFLSMQVRDSQNNLLESVNLNGYQPNNVITLQNGLALSLSTGSLSFNDSFIVNVNDSLGSIPELDKPFDGIRNQHPNLEDGFNVSAGSFEVNHVSINVFANDTINTIINRISSSAAGVYAEFDASSETIRLTQQTAGSQHSIILANDTSGFVSAMKLNNGVLTSGVDASDDIFLPMSQVNQFSSVQSGTFKINDISIDLDVQTDSLDTLLNSINASAANVTATLDSAKRVSIVSNDVESHLSLDSVGTDIFNALNILDGSYEATKGSTSFSKTRHGLSSAQAKAFADLLEDVAAPLNAIFDDDQLGPSSLLNELRSAIEDSVLSELKTNGARFHKASEFKIDFRNGVDKVIDVSGRFSRSRLIKGLRSNTAEINKLLFGSNDKKSRGLVTILSEIAGRAETLLNDELGTSGRIVDILA